MNGWTEDRVSALKKLWAEGQSATQISKQLGGGLTRNAVIGKVHRLGLSGRTVPSQPAHSSYRSTQHRTHAPSPPRPIASAPKAEDVKMSPPMPELPGTAVLMSLGSHMCKWPIGDPAQVGFSFCGRKAQEGAYCVEHARVAYQPRIRKSGTDGGAELARSLRRYI